MIRLRCYDPSDDQDGGLYAWYSRESPSVRAAIDQVLRLLSLETSVAAAPQLKPLRKNLAALVEVKIDFEQGGKKVNVRILGYENGPHELVLLVGFRKTGNAGYGPAGRSALHRREGVMRDERRAVSCRFPLSIRPNRADAR